VPKKFVKDKDALLDYKFDWGEFLGTDQIVSAIAFTDAVASAQASGLRIASVNLSGENAVIVWLSAGVPDTEYEVTVRIHTSAGRRNDECCLLYIQDC
jgi:acyl-CoA reductase-like NAD-dependent aldehyde dehydrogenase